MSMENLLQLNLNPSAVDMDPNLAFLYELYLSKGPSEKIQYSYLPDDENFFTDFEKYFESLDLSPEVEDELEEENKEKNISTIHKLIRNQKLSFYEFFQKIHSFRINLMERQFSHDPFSTKSKAFFNVPAVLDDSKYYFENLAGNVPRNWPVKIDDFIQSLQGVPHTAFFYQPFKLYSSFYSDFEKRFNELLSSHQKKKMNDTGFVTLSKMMIIELLVNFLRGSFYRTMNTIDRIRKISEQFTQTQNQFLNQSLIKICAPMIKGFFLETEKASVEFTAVSEHVDKIFTLSDLKSYDINIQDGYSVTTDGTFIYEAIASPNLIHLVKIGTGNCGTEAGIIYKEITIPLIGQKSISLIYLKNKLILKYNIDNIGSIDVYSSENLEKSHSVHLNLKEYFKNPHLTQFNKFFQLFTDGESLFSVLLKYKFVKIEKEKTVIPVPKSKVVETGKDVNKKPTSVDHQSPEKPPKESANSVIVPNPEQEELNQKPKDDPLNKQTQKSPSQRIQNIRDINDYHLENTIIASEPRTEGDHNNAETAFNKDNFAFLQEQLDQKLIESLINEERMLMSQIKETMNRNIIDLSNTEDNDNYHKQVRNIFDQNPKDFITPESADKKAEAKDFPEDSQGLIDEANNNIFDQGFVSKIQNFEKTAEGRQSSILFIKNLFRSSSYMNRNSSNRAKNEEAEGDEPKILNFDKWDKISFFKNLENEQIVSEDLIPEFLKYSRENLVTGRTRGRGRPLINRGLAQPVLQNKSTTSNTSVPPVEGEKHLIEFYVVKFDLDKQERQTEEIDVQSILGNPLAIELFTSFSSFYSLTQCALALKKSGGDIQIAAEWLLKETNNSCNSKEFQPVSQILIYQTESQGYDFKQNKIIKPFNVVAKSLLTPNDVFTGSWFVKDDLLLKNNGNLFSLDSKDEIVVEPHELENPENFLKSKISKFEEIFEKPHNEGFEWILKKLKDADRQNLKQTLNVPEAALNFKGFKIHTTYLKTYSHNPFYTANASKKAFYDNKNGQFGQVLFEKLANANYGFMKQRFTFYSDNSKETKWLKELMQTNKENSKTVNILLSIVNSKNVEEFLDSFLDMVIWANENRPELPHRLNDWVYSLSKELKAGGVEKGKKSKANLNSKIKKLIEIKLKAKMEMSVMLNHFNKLEKCEGIREIGFVHFLCIKGNLKTLKYLITRLTDPVVKKQTKLKLLNILKCSTQYIHISNNISGLASFGDYLFDILKHVDFTEIPELKIAIIKLCWVFIPNRNYFMKFFIHAIYQDDDFFLGLVNELFSTNHSLQNVFPFNNRILFNCLKNLSVDEKTDKVLEYSLLVKLKKIIGKGFTDNFQISEIYKELTGKLLIKKEENWFCSVLKAICIVSENCFLYVLSKKNKLIKQSKDAQAVNSDFDRFKEALILHLLDLLNKIYKEKRPEELSSAVQSHIKSLESLLFALLFKARIRNVQDLESIIKSVIMIISKNIEYYTKFYPNEMRSLKSNLSKLSLTGISQLDTHIIETPHPIERGKNITFKRIFHETAIGYILEFDKRSQDEESTDSLIITSWYHPEKKGTANLTADAILNRYINISGKKTFKKGIVMVGNSLDAQFISSNMAKNNAKSLSQWGYKIFIRPIYGQTITRLKAGDSLANEPFFGRTINIIENLTVCVRRAGAVPNSSQTTAGSDHCCTRHQLPPPNKRWYRQKGITSRGSIV